MGKVKSDFSEEEWDAIKSHVRGILLDIAKRKSLVTYRELSNAITTAYVPYKSDALSTLLGEISDEEDKLGRGLLSVVVVHSEGRMPGRGFFSLAKELGRDTEDWVKFFVEELNRVYGDQG